MCYRICFVREDMYYDEEFNSATLLRANVDFSLKRAHNENMLYKVKEILCEAYNHDIICLSRLIELEGILGFGIREYMLRAPGYFICEDAEYIKTLPEVNKYVAKQIGIRQNKSKYPKIGYENVRRAICNSR